MNTKLSVVADENMPHIERLFHQYANITLLNGREITNAAILHADALLCRSVTQVDQALIEGSRVQFVGTATIGVDHLALDWLKQHNVACANAAGCNAAAVAQYVLSAIAVWLKKYQRRLSEVTVGIVGAGNVGTELSRCLDCLGVKYLLCDPPLQRQMKTQDFHPLSEILQCDVITVHVPLICSGPDATYHLIDKNFMESLSPAQLVINAARGAVIDNQALIDYLSQKRHAEFILDVFENEPNIAPLLVNSCFLATPHIAGHTLEGKSRGSYRVYEAFCEHFCLSKTIGFDTLLPAKNRLDSQTTFENELDGLLTLYDIRVDDAQLRLTNCKLIDVGFDDLRKSYSSINREYSRRDYSGWISNERFPQTIAKLLS